MPTMKRCASPSWEALNKVAKLAEKDTELLEKMVETNKQLTDVMEKYLEASEQREEKNPPENARGILRNC